MSKFILDTGLFTYFAWFCYQNNASVIEELGNTPSSYIFWKRSYKIGVNYSLNIRYNSPVKLYGPYRFLFRELLY